MTSPRFSLILCLALAFFVAHSNQVHAQGSGVKSGKAVIHQGEIHEFGALRIMLLDVKNYVQGDRTHTQYRTAVLKVKLGGTTIDRLEIDWNKTYTMNAGGDQIAIKCDGVECHNDDKVYYAVIEVQSF